MSELLVTWPDGEPSSTLDLSVAAFGADEPRLEVRNAAVRHLRVELFSEDPAASASVRHHPLPMVGSSDPVMDLLGLDQHVVPADSTALAALPWAGASFEGVAVIPLAAFPAHHRLWLQLVGYSEKVVTVGDVPTYAPDAVPAEIYHVGPGLSRWQMLQIGYVVGQVVAPALAQAVGAWGSGKDWGLLLATIAVATANDLRSNHPGGWTAFDVVTSAVGAIVTQCANGGPIWDRLKKLLGAGASDKVTRLLPVIKALQALALANLLAGWKIVETLGPIATAEILTPMGHTTIAALPPALGVTVLGDVAADAVVTWSGATDVLGSRHRALRTDAAVIEARGSLDTGLGELWLTDLRVTEQDGTVWHPAVSLVVGPAAGSGALVVPAGWDPALGVHDVAVRYEAELAPLLDAVRAGVGALQVGVVNHEHHALFADAIPPRTDLVVPLAVSAAEPTFHHAPETSVAVGDTGPVPFEVRHPLPERRRTAFASAEPFRGRVTLSADHSTLALEDLQVMRSDRWTGQPGWAPFELGLRVRCVGSGEAVARLVGPEPAGLDPDGLATYDGLGPFLEGVAPGEGELVVDVLPGADPQRWSTPEPAHLQVQVTARALDLEVAPVAAGDAVVIEDDWLDDEQRLVGGFVVRVRREGTVLWSSEAPAALLGTVGADRLDLTDVYTEDADGVLHRQPFALRATVADPTVARFEGPSGTDTPSGELAAWGSLDRLLNAVGAGQTTVLVELRHAGADPETPESPPVRYEMPPAAKLTVVVPPPLVATLTAWHDAHHGGQVSPIDLTGPAPHPHLIHSSGTAHGSVEHHRPQSQRESVDLTVIPHSGTGGSNHSLRHGTTSLLEPSDGTFTRAVSGFDAHQGLGYGINQLQLSAWKPINQVVDGGPSTTTAELRGVLPIVTTFGLLTGHPVRSPTTGEVLAVGSVDPSADRIVLHRGVASGEVKASRALSLQVVAQVHAGATAADGTSPSFADTSTTPLAEDPDGSYDPYTWSIGGFSLPPGPAPCAVLCAAAATNDYGTTRSYPVTFFAPLPNLEQVALVPLGTLGAFKTDEPRFVGHNTKAAERTVRTTNALEIRMVGVDPATGVEVRPVTPFHDTDQAFRLPAQGDLVANDIDPTQVFNRFDVSVSNEFGEQHLDPLHLHRRANGYSSEGKAGLRLVDTTGKVRLSGWIVREDDSTEQLPDGGKDFDTDWFGPDPTIGFKRISFVTQRLNTNNTWGWSSEEVDVTCQVLLLGPDYGTQVMVVGAESEWISADNESLSQGTKDGYHLYLTVRLKGPNSTVHRVIRFHRTPEPPVSPQAWVQPW